MTEQAASQSTQGTPVNVTVTVTPAEQQPYTPPVVTTQRSQGPACSCGCGSGGGMGMGAGEV